MSLHVQSLDWFQVAPAVVPAPASVPAPAPALAGHVPDCALVIGAALVYSPALGAAAACVILTALQQGAQEVSVARAFTRGDVRSTSHTLTLTLHCNFYRLVQVRVVQLGDRAGFVEMVAALTDAAGDAGGGSGVHGGFTVQVTPIGTDVYAWAQRVRRRRVGLRIHASGSGDGVGTWFEYCLPRPSGTGTGADTGTGTGTGTAPPAAAAAVEGRGWEGPLVTTDRSAFVELLVCRR